MREIREQKSKEKLKTERWKVREPSKAWRFFEATPRCWLCEAIASLVFIVVSLHISHKKYSVWALTLKAIRLWQWVDYEKNNNYLANFKFLDKLLEQRAKDQRATERRAGEAEVSMWLVVGDRWWLFRRGLLSLYF